MYISTVLYIGYLIYEMHVCYPSISSTNTYKHTCTRTSYNRHQALPLCVKNIKRLGDSHTFKPLYFQGKEAQQETEDYQVKKAVNLQNSIRGR